MTDNLRCWCGSTDLAPFSPDYLQCRACGTLVYAGQVDSSISTVSDDSSDFYGKNYWLDYLVEKGQPSIIERSRLDLSERCLYWLRSVLKYKLPPGTALELGSSHGGFVKLLRQAGFNAAGLELSPWVTEYARRTFNIPMLLGPLESQEIEPGSLDFIALMDVLEHLPDPTKTMQLCLRLLKPDGILFIQTPRYPEEKTYRQLEETGDPFLAQLKPKEHLFLFSIPSISAFFARLDAQHIQFEPAIFSQYDMFLAVSRQPLQGRPWPEVEGALEATPEGRVALALLDLDHKYQDAENRYRDADRDRADRLEAITQLDHLLRKSESDRAARLSRINDLERRLAESESDRAARLVRINELERRLVESESDRAARLSRIKELENRADATQKAIAQLTQTIPYRASRRLGGMKPFESALAKIPTTQGRLRRIIVDLTPVRPGGENGGAKPLALELIKRLSREIAPEIEYILFTSSDAHEELSWLDGPNLRRICVNQVSMEVNQAADEEAPEGSPAPGRPLWRRVTRRIGRILETIIPIGTYRKIYRLYHRQVNTPRINNLVRSLEADLVFCPFTAVYYYAPEVPVAVIVHDLQYLYYPEFFSPEQNYHSSRNLQQVLKLATRIICVSEYTRQTVLKAGEVDPERVVTIPSTIFTPLAEQPLDKVAVVLDKLHLRAGEYLFFPANFWRHKNHAMLLTAFYQYIQKYPQSNLKLVFSGTPGQRMQFLQDAAGRMKLTERVVFAGYVEPGKLAALFQGCLAVIFPSLYEGFGAPVLEGMHFGKPVLSSNLTSLPEIGGSAVLYFDPRRPEEIVKAIEKIVNEPGLARELALKGQQQAARFANPYDWAGQYLRAFMDATSAGRSLQNSLIGMFPDGWAGDSLEISVSASTPVDRGGRQFVLEINLPPWFPQEKAVLEFQGEALQQERTFSLGRGQTHKIILSLRPQGGVFQCCVNATICPKDAGINDDTRQVSFTILSCQVISGGHSIELV